MPIKYTKAVILDFLKKDSDDMSTLYQKDYINFRGKTEDSNELYTEIIAEWCCTNIDKFNRVDQITRTKSYKVDGHAGIGRQTSNRKEELIAMAMFRQGKVDGVGKILDYQTPLKTSAQTMPEKLISYLMMVKHFVFSNLKNRTAQKLCYGVFWKPKHIYGQLIKRN